MTRMERLKLQAFKNVMDKRKAQEEPQFLSEAHKKNYEKGQKQIAEWQKSPPSLEEAMEKQRIREGSSQSKTTRMEHLKLRAFKNVMNKKKHKK